MDWTLEEAVSYYRNQGAPRDQSALISLLKEIQQEHSDSIPLFAISQIAESFGVKESFLLALIRRIPSLRLGDTHELLICRFISSSSKAFILIPIFIAFHPFFIL